MGESFLYINTINSPPERRTRIRPTLKSKLLSVARLDSRLFGVPKPSVLGGPKYALPSFVAAESAVAPRWALL